MYLCKQRLRGQKGRTLNVFSICVYGPPARPSIIYVFTLGKICPSSGSTCTCDQQENEEIGCLGLRAIHEHLGFAHFNKGCKTCSTLMHAVHVHIL